MRTLDFPAHACGLYLTHNEHRDTYTPLSDFIKERGLADDFASPEAMRRALDTDECWVLQWYPNTPVGFNRVAAPTLAEVLALCTPTADKLRDPITPMDFGVPAEYQEHAENYARWVAAAEREACAKIADVADRLNQPACCVAADIRA